MKGAKRVIAVQQGSRRWIVVILKPHEYVAEENKERTFQICEIEFSHQPLPFSFGIFSMQLLLLLSCVFPTFSLSHSSSSSSDTNRRTLFKRATSIAVGSLLLPVASTRGAEPLLPLPEITQKVFFDLRIARSDGTFAYRGDDDDEPVLTTQLVFGLFGEQAPAIVDKFLQYATELDFEKPSYARSSFPAFIDGVVTGGFIKGLTLENLNGASVLNYKGNIYKSSLWLDSQKSIPHDRFGLLTHRNLSVEPTFQLTTTKNLSLDTTSTAFGTILKGEEVIRKIEFMPTYSVNDSAIENTIFNQQATVFRKFAKTMGDTRLDNTFDGKLLRKIEVTKCGLL